MHRCAKCDATSPGGMTTLIVQPPGSHRIAHLCPACNAALTEWLKPTGAGAPAEPEPEPEAVEPTAPGPSE